ncbi:13141_t:CDS:1, partial [Acaulospora colombiana]
LMEDTRDSSQARIPESISLQPSIISSRIFVLGVDSFSSLLGMGEFRDLTRRIMGLVVTLLEEMSKCVNLGHSPATNLSTNLSGSRDEPRTMRLVSVSGRGRRVSCNLLQPWNLHMVRGGTAGLNMGSARPRSIEVAWNELRAGTSINWMREASTVSLRVANLERTRRFSGVGMVAGGVTCTSRLSISGDFSSKMRSSGR